MASRMIHYFIANEILEERNFEQDIFILGNLAPDACAGITEGNWRSHFRIHRDEGVEDYIDLIAFREKYKKALDNHFILGYYCHLIADNIWQIEIFKEYFKGYSEEEIKKRVNLCYIDYVSLNSHLIKHFKLG